MRAHRPSARQTRRTIVWMQRRCFASKNHRNRCASHAEMADVEGYHNELYCSTDPCRCGRDRCAHQCRHRHHKNQFRIVYRTVQSPPDAKFRANDMAALRCHSSFHPHCCSMHSPVRSNSEPFAIVVSAPWTIWSPCTSTRLFCTKILEIPSASAIDPIRRLHSIRCHAHPNPQSFFVFVSIFRYHIRRHRNNNFFII